MNIQLSQTLFQMINFAILVGALSYLLYKPMLQIFKNRTKKIEEGQQAAQESINERAQIDLLKKEAKQTAQKEAAQILKEAKKQAEQNNQQAIEHAKKQGEVLIEKMKKDWQSSQDQRTQEIKATMIEAVIAISTKIIGQALDSKTHTQLINNEINAFIKQIKQ